MNSTESCKKTSTMYQLYKGDCLQLMDDIPNESVDLVLTDPPYMINTKSTGAGKLNPWADYCNASYWYAEWMQKARAKLKPTGGMWTFLNWRSFVTFQKAACDIGWPIESVLVWDKCWIGPGGPKGLRPSYELVALFAMPEFQIKDRGLYDIQRFKWSSKKPHGHPAEKPVDLMQWIVEKSTEENAIVVDLFMGSGTTGEACANTCRRFIGMEMDDTYFNIASERVSGAFLFAEK